MNKIILFFIFLAISAMPCIFPADLSAADDNDINVGVFYYPWYGNVRHDGFTVHWDGGYLRKCLAPAPYPQTPMICEYSSRDPQAIRQHLDWSELHGIDTWICSWWGWRPGVNDNRPAENIEDYIMPELIGRDVKFCLFYESTGILSGGTGLIYFNESKIRQFAEDFRYIARTYFDHPNYYKINGRPVVYIYLTRVFQGDVPKAIRAIRDEVKNATKTGTFPGYDIYLVADEVYWGPPILDKIALYDAITAYNMHSNESMNDNYPDYTGFCNRVANKFAEYKTKVEYLNQTRGLNITFIPDVLTGFNSRGTVPQPPIQHYTIPRQMNRYASHTSTFEKMCDIANTLLPAANRMVCITSWNEWHEDTQIEPSVVSDPANTPAVYTLGGGGQYYYKGYGEDYLEALREKFNKGPYILLAGLESSVDIMPRETAARPYYTGVASALMVLKYMYIDSPYENGQDFLYSTYHSGAIGADMDGAELCELMNREACEAYKYAFNADHEKDMAIKRFIHWMNYYIRDAPMSNAPALIPTDGKYNWKVVKGFVTDRSPSDQNDIHTVPDFQLLGVWLNDPQVNGLGFDVYMTAEEFSAQYQPLNGSYISVAENAGDITFSTDTGINGLSRSSTTMAKIKLTPVQANTKALSSLRGVTTGKSPVKPMLSQGTQTDWETIIPVALKQNPVFKKIFSGSSYSKTFSVSDVSTGPYQGYSLVLFTKGDYIRSPSILLIVDPVTGAFKQASWGDSGTSYPLLSQEQAVEIASSAAGVPAGVIPVVSMAWSKNFNTSRFVPSYKVVFPNKAVVYVHQDGTFMIGNKAPVLQRPIGPLTVSENQHLNFSISARDDNGDTLRFQMSGLPSNASLNDNLDNTAAFSWAPLYEQGSRYPYLAAVTVTDGSFTDSETISITVNNVNRPPVIASIPDQVVTEGNIFQLQLSAADPDQGDALEYSQELSSGPSLSQGGLLTWQPGFDAAGEYTLNLKVSDKPSHPDDFIEVPFTVKINVLETHHPRITSVSNFFNICIMWWVTDPGEPAKQVNSMYRIDNGVWEDAAIWRVDTFQASSGLWAVNIRMIKPKLLKGNHIMEVKAIDKNGAESMIRSVKFKIN